MKKIIAILLALAVVSMAFAQTVSISNTLQTQPKITIDGGNQYWQFADGFFLRDQVTGEAVTADGRAKVKGVIRFDLSPVTPLEGSILSFKPRWSWNSAADNSIGEGNRSQVGAVIKPFDFLEIGIGNVDMVGYAMNIGPNFDWSEWSTWYRWGFNTIPGVVGQWQRLSVLIYDGIQAVYTGVPNLKIGVGLESARNEKNGHGYKDLNTMIKKGMFNGPSVGATYDTDLFGVGAVWKGNFGMEAGAVTENNVTTYNAEQFDKAFQDHTIYASFTFKGLQEAKIGTKIYAAVGFYTAKASPLVEWEYYDANAKATVKKTNTAVTSFLFDIGAGFNFRNGISNDINVGVGYYKIGSTTSKVLPFCVRDTITYSASSDATFAFTIGYSQAGLAEKKTVAGTANSNNKDIMAAGAQAVATTDNGSAWLVFAYPRFSWNMGAHSFNVGLRTSVDGDLVPHEKTGYEWGWTGLRGKQAVIDFPLSWTYTF